MATHQQHDAWDAFWKDGQGNYVIWQMPNIWLIAWAILTLLSLFTLGTVSTVFSWISTVSLAVWAVLEVLQGVNYFRRTLGVVVLIFVIANFIKLLK